MAKVRKTAAVDSGLSADMMAAIQAAVVAAVAGNVRQMADDESNIVSRGNGRKAVIVDVDDDGDIAAAGDNVLSANTTAEGWRFPATYRDAKGKLKTFKVNPNDRKAFMQATAETTFGVTITSTTYDRKGNEQTAEFPAVAALTHKQFSSGNHGIYGRIESSRIVLIDGDEYILTGQVNMQLAKRIKH